MFVNVAVQINLKLLEHDKDPMRLFLLIFLFTLTNQQCLSFGSTFSSVSSLSGSHITKGHSKEPSIHRNHRYNRIFNIKGGKTNTKMSGDIVIEERNLGSNQWLRQLRLPVITGEINTADDLTEKDKETSSFISSILPISIQTVSSNNKSRLPWFSLGGMGVFPFLRSTFLPEGYPHTTPKEYTTYQSWNLVQDLCSYLRGVLSTRAILEGFGVGRNDVTAVQASVQWILRDGASMLGGLLFTSFSSANFGQNIKSWRLFADLINNVGITLDMLAPIFRNHFLTLVCIASICKALCGIAAGATGKIYAYNVTVLSQKLFFNVLSRASARSSLSQPFSCLFLRIGL